MTQSLGLETRDVTVGSALQRHQMCQLLRLYEVDWTDESQGQSKARFTITATAEQWQGIDEWIERIKEGR